MLPRGLLLAPVVALLTLLLVGPPAQAVVTGTVSADDLVLRNKCRHQPVDYAFGVSPDTLLWQVKLTMVSPTGRTSEGIDLSSVDGDAVSGTVRFLVCGSADPGTYTVKTVGTYQVVPLVNIPVTVADTTFEVRRAATRTVLAGKSLGSDRYRLTAKVKDERRRGFKPTNSAEVVFQEQVGDTWKTIPGSRTMTQHGFARTVVSRPAGSTVRAVTLHSGYLGGSASQPVTLHP